MDSYCFRRRACYAVYGIIIYIAENWSNTWFLFFFMSWCRVAEKQLISNKTAAIFYAWFNKSLEYFPQNHILSTSDTKS